MNQREVYDWHGDVIKVDVYDATGGEEWDLSPMNGQKWEHPTGRVPVGEIHYQCELVGREGVWWASHESFWKHAIPISPDAHERAAQVRDYNE